MSRELEMPQVTMKVLREILRTAVEDQSVPANYLIVAEYDYQVDQLDVEIINKIGLDVIVTGTL